MNNLKLKCKIIFIVLFGLMMLFYGCSDAEIESKEDVSIPKDFDVLTTEIENQIKQDYIDWQKSSIHGLKITIDDVVFVDYGIYNGCVPMHICHKEMMFPAALGHEIIGNTIFIYSSFANPIKVWKEGQFYLLTAAYNQGFLTQDDIKSIADNYANKVGEYFVQYVGEVNIH